MHKKKKTVIYIDSFGFLLKFLNLFVASVFFANSCSSRILFSFLLTILASIAAFVGLVLGLDKTVC